MSIGLFKYYLWRFAYIAIKPVSLLISARFISEEFANDLSLAIIISGVLMASLSFGSYRALLEPDVNKEQLICREKNRKSLFIVNMGGVLLITIGAVLFFESMMAVFIYMFVVTEHIIHDEARLVLYKGDRVRWAKINCLRTSFILFVPVLCYFTGVQYLSVWMFILFILNLFYSFNTKGLMYNIEVDKLDGAFLRGYFEHYNYFQSSLINKLSQQSDKIIYGLILFETLWVYTLITQLANVVLTYFEVVHMSRFKSEILKVKDFTFSYIRGTQLIQMLGVSLVVIAAYLVIFEFYFSDIDSNFYTLLFLLFGNLIMATNMMNSERLFWKLKRPKDFHVVEFKSFIVGQLFVTPFIIFYGLATFTKLPALVSASFKIIKARECLKK